MRSQEIGDREDRLAEERLLLMTQVAIQRELNRQGLRYRDLAQRLGVSEARISQLMGDDALNLTIRTVAKVFHRLGQEVLLTTKREYDLDTQSIEGEMDIEWEFGSPSEINFSVGEANQIVLEEFSKTSDELEEWAEAEAAAMRRWVA